MELIDLPDFGPDDYAAIVDGETDPYGTDSLDIVWREKSGHVGLTTGGRLVAHAGWVPVRVRARTGPPLEVVGLGGVMVHRDHRGQGAGHQLVVGAMERMGVLDTGVGMLFCRTARQPFYERLGWRPLEATVTADQPEGSVVIPLVTCWVPLLDGASFPATELHVEGLPF